MKNKAEEIIGFYWAMFCDNPAILVDVVDWKNVIDKLREACRVSDNQSLIQKGHQVIKALLNNQCSSVSNQKY